MFSFLSDFACAAMHKINSLNLMKNTKLPNIPNFKVYPMKNEKILFVYGPPKNYHMCVYDPVKNTWKTCKINSPVHIGKMWRLPLCFTDYLYFILEGPFGFFIYGVDPNDTTRYNVTMKLILYVECRLSKPMNYLINGNNIVRFERNTNNIDLIRMDLKAGSVHPKINICVDGKIIYVVCNNAEGMFIFVQKQDRATLDIFWVDFRETCSAVDVFYPSKIGQIDCEWPYLSRTLRIFIIGKTHVIRNSRNTFFVHNLLKKEMYSLNLTERFETKQITILPCEYPVTKEELENSKKFLNSIGLLPLDLMNLILNYAASGWMYLVFQNSGKLSRVQKIKTIDFLQRPKVIRDFWNSLG